MNVLTTNVICLHFGVPHEDILGHTNGKSHLFTL